MLEVVLVADSGAVAARLLHAYQELGVKAVAVHCGADVDAVHVGAADDSVLLRDEAGYADVAQVVEAALRSRAQAVHPGAGPLSRDPDAPAEVEEAGLRFLAPHPPYEPGPALLARLRAGLAATSGAGA